MNVVEIPTKFELARVLHSVKEVEYTGNENLGTANGNTCIIEISRFTQRMVIPRDKQLNTFYHELVHQILFTIDHNKLSSDEKFVTAFGNMLMEFDLTRDNVPVKVIEASMCFVDGED